MKAVRFHQHGGPDVLRFEDAPDPAPAPGRAIVRVRACALNHLDLWERRGIDRVPLPLPHISGSDIAGDVLDAGVSTPDPVPPGPTVAAGARVMLQPGLRCGRCRACREGRDNECVEYELRVREFEGHFFGKMLVKDDLGAAVELGRCYWFGDGDVEQ